MNQKPPSNLVRIMEEIKITNDAKKILERRSKQLNMSLSEVIEYLDKIDQKPKEEKPMEKEKELDPENEIKNNKLDLQSEKLSEMKELLSTTKDLIKQLPTKGDIAELKKPSSNELEIGKMLGEIKESIVASKKDFLEKLAKLNDLEKRLKLSNDRDDTIEQTLLEIKEKQTPQEPLFDPELFEVFKRFSTSLYKGDLNKMLARLLYGYNEDYFKVKYKVLCDKYLGAE